MFRSTAVSSLNITVKDVRQKEACQVIVVTSSTLLVLLNGLIIHQAAQVVNLNCRDFLNLWTFLREISTRREKSLEWKQNIEMLWAFEYLIIIGFCNFIFEI